MTGKHSVRKDVWYIGKKEKDIENKDERGF